MRPLLYNLLFPIVLVILLPSFLVRMIRRGKYRHKFGQRLGIYSARVRKRIARREQAWMHAVSVGEVLIALKLAEEMKRRDPGLSLVLSTTTSTGFAVANEKGPDWIEVIYNPVDFLFAVRSAFNLIRPKLLVLVEAEVWPNLVWQARKRAIPVVLVNARLSPRSERRFRRYKWLVAPVFRLLDLVCAQEPEDTRRWQALGVGPDKIRQVGSIKFDYAVAPRPDPSLPSELLNGIGVDESRLILLGGSTHPGEEKILAETFLQLRSQYPGLFLVVVPRHVERTPSILTELEPLSLNIVLRTEIEQASPGQHDCLLLNTTGELRNWYPVATVVFIGKTLTAKGGQNPMEAVVAQRPIVFGPHTENFLAVTELLLRNEGAVRIETAHQLAPKTAELLANPGRCTRIVENAGKALQPHDGATARTADLLDTLVPEES